MATTYLDTCEQVLAQLSDYFDDLDAETGAEVEKHLHECRTCLEFADSLRRTIELCRGYSPSIKPRPLTPLARAELGRAWQQALADRQRGSQPADDAAAQEIAKVRGED